jgi:hypothetical protein
MPKPRSENMGRRMEVGWLQGGFCDAIPGIQAEVIWYLEIKIA